MLEIKECDRQILYAYDIASARGKVVISERSGEKMSESPHISVFYFFEMKQIGYSNII